MYILYQLSGWVHLILVSIFYPINISLLDKVWGPMQVLYLQSIIQNTLEQSLLAFITYLMWCVLLPGNMLSVVPMASIAFVIGRILFILGYGYGAPARALGFTLSFYVTNGMLFYLAYFHIKSIFWNINTKNYKFKACNWIMNINEQIIQNIKVI